MLGVCSEYAEDMHAECEGSTDSAAAAGLAQLQVHGISLLQLDSYVALPPLVFSPSGLLAIQHYVGPEPIHGNGGL